MCVCVYVFSGRVGPTGKQKASRQDDMLNLCRPILSRGEGVPENQHKYEKQKRKRKQRTSQNIVFCYAERFSQKMEGSTAGRLPRFYATK